MSGVPGQPLVILHRVQTDHVAQILDGLAAKTAPGAALRCARSKTGIT